MQGYNKPLSVGSRSSTSAVTGYDGCLTRLLTRLLERREHKEGSVLATVYLFTRK